MFSVLDRPLRARGPLLFIACVLAALIGPGAAAASQAGFATTSQTIATVTDYSASSARVIPDNWGAFYAFYVTNDPIDGVTPALMVRSRPVDSSTWGVATRLSTAGETVDPHIEVVVDGSSNITVAYQTGSDASSRIRTVTHVDSHNPAPGWGAQTTLSDAPPSATSANVQLAVNDYGDLTAVWEHTDAGLTYIVGATRFHGAASQWSDPDFVSPFAVGTSAGEPDVALDARGTATAVWTRDPLSGTSTIETSTAAVPEDPTATPVVWSASSELANTGDNQSPRVLAHFGGAAHAVWLHDPAAAHWTVTALTRPAYDSGDPVPSWPSIATAEDVSNPADQAAGLDVALLGNEGFGATWVTNLGVSAECAIKTRTRKDDGTWNPTETLATTTAGAGPVFGSPKLAMTAFNTGVQAFKESGGSTNGVRGAFRNNADTAWNTISNTTGLTIRPSGVNSNASPIDADVIGSDSIGAWGGVTWVDDPAGLGLADIKFTTWATRPVQQTAPPAPTGTVQVGSTVSIANSGTFSGLGPITKLVVWQRCTADSSVCFAQTSGSNSYTIQSGDAGYKIRARVVATNAGGDTTVFTSFTGVVPDPALAKPTNTAQPHDARGTVAQGFSISSTVGAWDSPGSYSTTQNWQRCQTADTSTCADLTGETALTFLVSGADVGKRLRLRVRATNANGSTDAFSDITNVVPDPPLNTGPPSGPSGAAKEGETLSYDLGGWSRIDHTTFHFRWFRCNDSGCPEIANDSRSYKLTLADVGSQMYFVVQAVDTVWGITEVFGAPSGVVQPFTGPSGGTIKIDGVANTGHTLRGSASFEGDAHSISYQWYDCSDDLTICTPESAGTSHTIRELQFGRKLKFTATASNKNGTITVDRVVGPVARDVSPNCPDQLARDRNGDPDKDAIPTWMECETVVIPGEPGAGEMRLGEVGADPLHRDLFLEVDTMNDHPLLPDAAERVEKAFSEAPVDNPDGRTGIDLHIDYDSSAPIEYGSSVTWSRLSRANSFGHVKWLGSFDSDKKYDWAQFVKRKDANQDSVRQFAFSYLLVVHRYGSEENESSGIARAGNFTTKGLGQDFIMSLGGFRSSGHYKGTVEEQAGTLMHEYGHVLGLGHGGRIGGVADHENYKPNYPSIMNYEWQLTGIKQVKGDPVLDYSRYGSGQLPTLDEQHLDERIGVKATGGAAKFMVARVCTNATYFAGVRTWEAVERQSPVKPNTAIDWDCVTDAKGSSIRADINRQEDSTTKKPYPEAFGTLRPANDWTALVYSGGAIGSAGAGPTGPGGAAQLVRPAPSEAYVAPMKTDDLDRNATPETLMQSVVAVRGGDKVKPKASIKAAKQKKGQRTVKVTVTVTDETLLSNYTVQIDRTRPATYTERTKGTSRTVTLKKGRHVVVVTARDALGNASKPVRKIVVVR